MAYPKSFSSFVLIASILITTTSLSQAIGITITLPGLPPIRIPPFPLPFTPPPPPPPPVARPPPPPLVLPPVPPVVLPPVPPVVLPPVPPVVLPPVPPVVLPPIGVPPIGLPGINITIFGVVNCGTAAVPITPTSVFLSCDGGQTALVPPVNTTNGFFNITVGGAALALFDPTRCSTFATCPNLNVGQALQAALIPLGTLVSQIIVFLAGLFNIATITTT